MMMPGRSYSEDASYRYGFNGKENDNEVKGEGNQQDYGMRIYDPRLAKFFSVDPLTDEYPEFSPYQFAANSPLANIDLDGAEPFRKTIVHGTNDQILQEHWFPSKPAATPNIYTETHVFYSFQTGTAKLTNSYSVVIILKVKQAKAEVHNAGKLGALSEKYESNGVGTVSTGKGDSGGVSYGNWQLASKKGRPEEFLQNEGSQWTNEFGDYKSGTAEFSKVWKEIAARDPENFKLRQHAFIKRTHYDVNVGNIKNSLGLDINSRSQALQDVAWSTAVQHGPGNNIFQKALKGLDVTVLTDAEIIKLVYAERRRKDENGNLVHFSKNSQTVQTGVNGRLQKEEKDALNNLNN